MDWIRVPLALLCSVIMVIAAPQKPGGEQIAIVSQTSDVQPDGGYHWSYETANGIKAEETGTLKKGTKPDNEDAIVAQGSYSYTDLEGNQISLTYVADDEGGFQPQGAHLPTPPPIPPAIQKALEYNAAHPEPEAKPSGRRK